ncbi:hypothetical protein HFP89_00745 [Wenzhouxiangella sp. XN79A]|uniref:sialidase family protein n=1 Tax=Wenzhouxiangella sp. XN79A TaxID=2724193 RepID=UPI00144AF401|nr:hypothetical protein [Wenzhouxiangella sp. XN79A]NKI33691.1 hypothetical protein [Wenzhouxiangella sp. XN79A]
MDRNSSRSRRIAGLMILTLLSPPSFGSGLSWMPLGPAGGRIDALTASPFAAGRQWALASGGIFASADGGATWSERSSGLAEPWFGPSVRRPLLASPTGPDALYLVGWWRLHASMDGGLSWQDRTPPAALLPSDTVLYRAVASRTVPGRVHVALFNGDLLTSSDAGRTWTRTPGSGLAFPWVINAIDSHPIRPDELFVAYRDFLGSRADHRLYRVTGGGTRWSLIGCASGCPWESDPIEDLGFSPGGRLWLVTEQGAARSDDDGTSWTPVAGGAGQWIEPHPSDPDRAAVGGRVGLSETSDGGAVWADVVAGIPGNSLGEPAETTQPAWDRGAPDRVLIGTEGNGVMQRSAAGSSTFVRVGVGLNALDTGAVVAVGSALLAGVRRGDLGAAEVLYRSSDGGSSWRPAGNGIGPDEILDFALDPDDSLRVHAAGTNRTSPDGFGSAGGADGGVYRSNDAGATWTVTDGGLPDDSADGGLGNPRFAPVNALAASPRIGSNELWAGGVGSFVPDGSGGFTQQAARIYSTIDLGTNWSGADAGLGGVEIVPDPDGFGLFSARASVVDLVVDVADPLGRTLYAAARVDGLFDDLDDPTPLSTPNGVFRSSDGGLSWSAASTGLPGFNDDPAAATADVSALAQDPTDPTGLTLYAAVYDDDVAASVYRSVDGAVSWARADVGLVGREVRDLLVHPMSGDVYAAVDAPGPGGVFVRPAGATGWSALGSGLPRLLGAHRLWLDASADRLYAGTDRSVWALSLAPDEDIDGAPDAVEQAAPNSGDGNGDSVPDAAQSSVASLLVDVAGLRGGDDYRTLAVVPLAGDCSRIEQVDTLAAWPDVPAERSHDDPFGGLGWRLPDCTEAQLTWIHHGRAFPDPATAVRAWQFDPSGSQRLGWQAVHAVVSGDRWTLTVRDGGAGDADEEPGAITVRAAVKVLAERFFRDGMEPE